MKDAGKLMKKHLQLTCFLLNLLTVQTLFLSISMLIKHNSFLKDSLLKNVMLWWNKATNEWLRRDLKSFSIKGTESLWKLRLMNTTKKLKLNTLEKKCRTCLGIYVMSSCWRSLKTLEKKLIKIRICFSMCLLSDFTQFFLKTDDLQLIYWFTIVIFLNNTDHLTLNDLLKKRYSLIIKTFFHWDLILLV